MNDSGERRLYRGDGARERLLDALYSGDGERERRPWGDGGTGITDAEPFKSLEVQFMLLSYSTRAHPLTEVACIRRQAHAAKEDGQ